MAVAGSLVINISADLGPFVKATKEGLARMKDLKAESKNIFASTRTAAEKYSLQMARLRDHLREGTITQDTFNRAARRAKRDMQDAGNATKTMGDRLREYATVGGIAGLAILAIRKAADALRAAFRAVTAAVSKAISEFAQFEQVQVAFRVLVGDAKEAEKLLRRITKLSIKTPLTPKELQQAAKQLLGFGVAAGEIPTRLRQLGDMAAGIGVPIGELAVIFGKAKSEGRIMSKDLNELAGRGIPVIKAFADMFGVAEDQVRKLASEGKLSFSNLVQVIEDATSQGGQFSGMLEAQSKTLIGLWSTVRGAIDEAFKQIGLFLVKTMDIGSIMGGVAEASIAVSEALRNLNESFLNQDVAGTTADWARSILEFAQIASGVIGDMVSKWNFIFKTFRASFNTMLMMMATSLQQLIAPLKLIESLMPGGPQIASDIDFALGTFIQGMSESIAEDFASASRQFGDDARMFFQDALNELDKLRAGNRSEKIQRSPQLKAGLGIMQAFAGSIFGGLDKTLDDQQKKLVQKGFAIGKALLTGINQGTRAPISQAALGIANAVGMALRGGLPSEPEKQKKRDQQFVGAFEKGSVQAESLITKALGGRNDPKTRLQEQNNKQNDKVIAGIAKVEQAIARNVQIQAANFAI